MRRRKAVIATKKNRLYVERKKRGLTQEQVAISVRLSKKGYNHIENGRRNPSWAVAQQLEKFFGIPASELLAECEDEVICKK